MARIRIARAEEHEVQNYKVKLLYDDEGHVVGAIVELPRTFRQVYIAVNEEVKIKLPRHVKKFLSKHGFRVS